MFSMVSFTRALQAIPTMKLKAKIFGLAQKQITVTAPKRAIFATVLIRWMIDLKIVETSLPDKRPPNPGQ